MKLTLQFEWESLLGVSMHLSTFQLKHTGQCVPTQPDPVPYQSLRKGVGSNAAFGALLVLPIMFQHTHNDCALMQEYPIELDVQPGEGGDEMDED